MPYTSIALDQAFYSINQATCHTLYHWQDGLCFCFISVMLACGHGPDIISTCYRKHPGKKQRCKNLKQETGQVNTLEGACWGLLLSAHPKVLLKQHAYITYGY